MLNDDVIRKRSEEQCAAITYQSIAKHLFEDHIHFSFIIKKNTKESWNVGKAPEAIQPVKLQHKSTVHSVPNKGSMKGNNVRKGQSIPDAKLSGGGVLKKEAISVEIEETKGAKSQPPDYSSINKVDNNKQFTSPAHCTEAMKRNDDELVSKFYFNLCASISAPIFIAEHTKGNENR